MFASLPSTLSRADQKRWEHTRLRIRLLRGTWAEDLERRRLQFFDPTALRVQGLCDVTKNCFRSTIGQLAALYDLAYRVSNDGGAADDMEAIIKAAGLPQLEIRHHRNVVGLRESLLVPRVAGTGTEARMIYRAVTPDFIEAEAPMDDPDQPDFLVEFRARKDPVTKRKVWTRDVWNVRDLDNPSFHVEDAQGKPTDKFDPRLDGEAYVWRYTQAPRAGVPFIPHELTHAERTGMLFDPWEGHELVDGALNTGVLFSFWNHVVRDASWPQRWAINAVPVGARGDTKDEGLTYIPLDPSSLLMLKTQTTSGSITAAVGQWAATADPGILLRTICDYAAQLAIDYGISPTDIQRTTGNAQSGFAVELTRDGVRTAQRRFRPEARRSDERLLEKTAAMMNRARGGVAAKLPESGYMLNYRGLPLTIAEQRLAQDRNKADREIGIASVVDLFMEVHGVSRVHAEQRLRQIQADNISFPTVR